MFTCFRPSKIVNRYTSQEIVCSCGKCYMCQTNKMSRYSQMCNLLDKSYKYCMFVTLTYSPEYLPTCYAEVEVIPGSTVKNKYIGDKVVPDKYKLFFFNTSDRLSKYDDLISEVEVDSLDKLYELEERMHLGANTYCYSSIHDLQNFHKRFRSYIDNHLKSDKDEILCYRHFSVSEYGQRRYRAHYHCLFFFDSDKLLQSFGEVLHSSWKYGRVDFSLSKGGAASYVASYVNSVVFVPEILTSGRFKARQIHSIGLTKEIFEGSKQKLYGHDTRKVVSNGLYLDKQDSTVQLKGDVSDYFFPSYLNNSCRSFGELYQLCTLARTVNQYLSKSERY